MAKYTPQTKDELKELVKDESIYLGDIDTRAIVNMSNLFSKSTRRDFRGIETWDTSNVVDMHGMFFQAKYFNHNINSWDTSSVVNMQSMFLGAENFNQPLNNWDTSSVVSMFGMFMKATNFNQPLDSWDTSNVEIMSRMFYEARNFNQNLNFWDISSVEDNQQMFWFSGIENLPKWWEKRIAVAELGEGGKDRSGFEELLDFDNKRTQAMIAQALLNPLSKEEKQRKKEERQRQRQAQAQQKAKKKPFYKSTLFICVVVVLIGMGFGWIKSNSKTPKPKESFSTTQTQQPRQSTPPQEQKPTLVMPKCDDKQIILNDIKNAQREGIRETIEGNLNLWTNIKKRVKTSGVELSSIDEYVGGMRLDYSDIKTTLRDETKYRVECSARVSVSHSLMPTPQIWAFRYTIQATGHNNNISVSGYKQINKDINSPQSAPKASNESQSVTQNAPSDESKNANSTQSAQSKNIQASFDCAKANTRVERLICADEELANLDIELAKVYANARNSLDNEGKKALLSEQKKWLENYNQCDDKPCVLHNLRKRIRTLQGYGGSAQGLRLKTNDEYVNLRQSPSGEILATIPKSDFGKISLKKVETNGKWIKVLYFPPNVSSEDKAITGYIHASQFDESSL